MYDEKRSPGTEHQTWHFPTRIDPACESTLQRMFCCHGGSELGAFFFDESEDDVHSVWAPTSTASDRGRTNSCNEADLDYELATMNVENREPAFTSLEVEQEPDRPSSPIPFAASPQAQDRMQALIAQKKRNADNRALMKARGQQIEGMQCTALKLNESAAELAANARKLKEKCKKRRASWGGVWSRPSSRVTSVKG